MKSMGLHRSFIRVFLFKGLHTLFYRVLLQRVSLWRDRLEVTTGFIKSSTCLLFVSEILTRTHLQAVEHVYSAGDFGEVFKGDAERLTPA